MSETSAYQQRETLLRRLGPAVREWLDDSTVSEIMANQDGRLWVYAHGAHHDTGATLTTMQREAIIGTIASLLGGEAHAQAPIVEGELPFSPHRFQGVLPPVSDAPLFVIRKHLLKEVRLNDYVTTGILDREQAECLRRAVHDGDTIVISGETGSGKTTMASALLGELVSGADHGALRLALLEDTRELQCPVANTIRLCSGPGVSLRDLVRASLRLFPTRIIVGEVRGGEALDMLKAWNTGHRGGLTTVHANGVADVYDRLALLVAETGLALPRALFARAVHLLVHITASGRQRRVTEMARVMPQGDDFTIMSQPVRSGKSQT